MKLKRFMSILLALMLLLSACSKGKADAPTAQTKPATSQNMGADLSTEAQAKLIGQTIDQWQHSGRMYSVMDLDRNGRLEVLASTIRENRTDSHTDIYEVNPEGTGLDKLKFDLHPGEAEPAFIADYLQCFCENGTYYYNVHSLINTPEEFTEQEYAMYKEGTTVHFRLMSTFNLLYNPDGSVAFSDRYTAAGKHLTELEADSLFADAFPNAQPEYRWMMWVDAQGYDDWSLFAEYGINHFLNFDPADYDVYDGEPEGDDTAGYTVMVYTNPNSAEYLNLEGEVVRLQGGIDVNCVVRFTVDSFVHATYEMGEWVMGLNYFHPYYEGFSIDCYPGVVYEFTGWMSEGEPGCRLRFDQWGRVGYYYLEEPGYGNDVLDLRYEEPQQLLPREDDPIVSLCRAYAGMLISVGTTEEMERVYPWQTMGNGVAMFYLHRDGYVPPEIPVVEWFMDAVKHTMFPYAGNIPLPQPGDPVQYTTDYYERYRVSDALYYSEADTHVVDIDVTQDGRIYVSLSVDTQLGNRGVVVYLQQELLDNPFCYIITGADIGKG